MWLVHERLLLVLLLVLLNDLPMVLEQQKYSWIVCVCMRVRVCISSRRLYAKIANENAMGRKINGKYCGKAVVRIEVCVSRNSCYDDKATILYGIYCSLIHNIYCARSLYFVCVCVLCAYWQFGDFSRKKKKKNGTYFNWLMVYSLGYVHANLLLINSCHEFEIPEEATLLCMRSSGCNSCACVCERFFPCFYIYYWIEVEYWCFGFPPSLFFFLQH